MISFCLKVVSDQHLKHQFELHFESYEVEMTCIVWKLPHHRTLLNKHTLIRKFMDVLSQFRSTSL